MSRMLSCKELFLRDWQSGGKKFLIPRLDGVKDRVPAWVRPRFSRPSWEA